MFLIPAKVVERFLGMLPVNLKYNLQRYLPVLLLNLMLSTQKPSMRQIGTFFLRFCRDKANVDRFLNNEDFDSLALLTAGIQLLLQQENVRKAHQWVVIIDTTHKRTTRKPKRAKKGKKPKRANSIKYKDKGKQGTGSQTQLWVMGLILTDSGARIPLPRKSYWTKKACKQYHLKYRSQVDLARELLQDVHPTADTEVIVVYDSFFEGSKLDKYCEKRQFTYVTPADSARKIAAEDGTPSEQGVLALGENLPASEFTPLVLTAKNEQYAAFRRSLRQKTKRTRRCYAVQKRTLHISKLGLRTVVFSKKEHKTKTQNSVTFKALITNSLTLSAAQIIELYELRWEIELFFKELKQSLHFTAYSFDDFAACERWVDLVLLAFVFLEYERLRILGGAEARTKKACVQHARTPQMIEVIKRQMLQDNIAYLQQALQSRVQSTTLLKSLERYGIYSKGSRDKALVM